MADHSTIRIGATITSGVHTAALKTERANVNVNAETTDKIVNALASVSGSLVDVAGSVDGATIDANAEIVTKIQTSSYPIYGGPHEVVPMATKSQTLETENMVVLHDITVRKIPYWETSNTNGVTAYIANEV